MPWHISNSPQRICGNRLILLMFWPPIDFPHIFHSSMEWSNTVLVTRGSSEDAQRIFETGSGRSSENIWIVLGKETNILQYPPDILPWLEGYPPVTLQCHDYGRIWQWLYQDDWKGAGRPLESVQKVSQGSLTLVFCRKLLRFIFFWRVYQALSGIRCLSNCHLSSTGNEPAKSQNPQFSAP